jgi:hypothetical protein
MQFEIDDTKFMPPSIAEVLCREILGIPISSATSDHMDPMHVKMGKPKKSSKGTPKAEVVIGVQFGHFRDTAVRLNEKANIPANKQKIMLDTIANLQEIVLRQDKAIAEARQFIERLQCTK